MTELVDGSTPIWIYSKDEELKLLLNSKGDFPSYNALFTEQLNGAIKLEFTVPTNFPKASLIENDGRAITRDRDGNLVEFIIRIPEDHNDSNGPRKYVTAEGGDYELIDEWMPGYKANNVTLFTALEGVLSNTRVAPGIVDDFGTQSVDLPPMTVRGAVQELIKLFGGQRRYRIDVAGNKITQRYIDVLTHRGEDNRKRFEHRKDIMSVRRTPDSTGIKTALYGYGAGGENDGPRLTFANVEWSKANGDPVDKPLGQTWVGDPDALQKWGYDKGNRHRFGDYSGQEDDPAELLLNTWKHLQTLNDAIYTYDFNVALLEKALGYEHEKVRLGDKVVLIDRELQPNIMVEAEIIEYRQNLNNDQLDEVTVGSFRPVFDTAGRVRSAEQTLENKQGNWDKKPTKQYVQSEVQKAFEEAERLIALAQKEIDAAKLNIENAAQEITETQSLIDSVTSVDESGVTVLNGTIITNKIVAENATLTGHLIADEATFLNGIFNKATIIEANIEDAVITGTLIGATGTFKGSMATRSLVIQPDISEISDTNNNVSLEIANVYRNMYGNYSFGTPFQLDVANGMASVRNVDFTVEDGLIASPQGFFGNLTVHGNDFVLGTISDRGNTGGSRAMVKGDGGTLIINYNNDFWGGVAIQGGVWANGGYILHDGPASEISTWDINGLKKTGFYRGNALANAPTYDWLYLVVIRHDDNYVVQHAYDYYSNTTWIRHCNGGNWSAWSALAFANHNHDGRYVRIAGANDCWLEITNNNNLNLYRNGAYVRTV